MPVVMQCTVVKGCETVSVHCVDITHYFRAKSKSVVYISFNITLVRQKMICLVKGTELSVSITL